MIARKRRRLAFVLALLVAGAGTAALTIAALKDNVLYFYTPSDVFAKHVAPGTAFRIGGLVEAGSLRKCLDARIRFVVTDGRAEIPVDYRGTLPALFHEGRGVVAMGRLTPSGAFEASQVLAKHDEKYTPPELAGTLRQPKH